MEADTRNSNVANRLTASTQSPGRKRRVEARALETTGVFNVCYSQFEQIADLQHDLEHDDARRKRKLKKKKRKLHRQEVNHPCHRSSKHGEPRGSTSASSGLDGGGDQPNANVVVRRRRRRKQVTSTIAKEGAAASIPSPNGGYGELAGSSVHSSNRNRNDRSPQMASRAAAIRREKKVPRSNDNHWDADGDDTDDPLGNDSIKSEDENDDTSDSLTTGSTTSNDDSSSSNSDGSRSDSSSSSASNSRSCSSRSSAHRYTGNEEKRFVADRKRREAGSLEGNQGDSNAGKHHLSSGEDTLANRKNQSGSLLGKRLQPCTASLSTHGTGGSSPIPRNRSEEKHSHDDEVTVTSRSVHSTSVIDVEGVRKRLSSNMKAAQRKDKRVERKISRNVEKETHIPTAPSDPLILRHPKEVQPTAFTNVNFGQSVTDTLPYECSPLRDRSSMERLKKSQTQVPISVLNTQTRGNVPSDPSLPTSLVAKPVSITVLLRMGTSGYGALGDDESGAGVPDTLSELDSLLLLASQMREHVVSTQNPSLPTCTIDPELLKDVVPDDYWLNSKSSEGFSGVCVWRRDNRKRFATSEHPTRSVHSRDRQAKRRLNLLAGLGDSSNMMMDYNVPNGESLYSQSVSATIHERHRSREDVRGGANASISRRSRGANAMQFSAFGSAPNQADEVDWYSLSKDHGADGNNLNRGSYGDALITPSVSRSDDVDRHVAPSRWNPRVSPRENLVDFWRPQSGFTPPTTSNRTTSVKSRSGGMDASSGYSTDNPLRKNTWNVHEKYLSDMSGNADMPSMTTKGSMPYGDSISGFARSRDKYRSYNAIPSGEDVGPITILPISGVDRLELLLERDEEEAASAGEEISPSNTRQTGESSGRLTRETARFGTPASTSQSRRDNDNMPPDGGSGGESSSRKEREKTAMEIKGRPKKYSVQDVTDDEDGRERSESSKRRQSSEYPVEPVGVSATLSAELLVPPSKVSKASRNSKSTTTRSRRGSEGGMSDTSPTGVSSSAKKSIVSDWLQRKTVSTTGLDTLTSSEEEDAQEMRSSKKSKGIGSTLLAPFRSSKSSGKQQNPKDSSFSGHKVSPSHSGKQIPVDLFHFSKRSDAPRKLIPMAPRADGGAGTDDHLAVSSTSDLIPSSATSPTAQGKEVESMGRSSGALNDSYRLPARPQPAPMVSRTAALSLAAQYQAAVGHLASGAVPIPTTPSKRREASNVLQAEALPGEPGMERRTEGTAAQVPHRVQSCNDVQQAEDSQRGEHPEDDGDALRQVHSDSITARENDVAVKQRDAQHHARKPSKGSGSNAENGAEKADTVEEMRKMNCEHGVALPSLFHSNHIRRASHQSPVVPILAEGMHPIPTPPVSPAVVPIERARASGFELSSSVPNKQGSSVQRQRTEGSIGGGLRVPEAGGASALPLVVSPMNSNSPWNGATTTQESTPLSVSETPHQHVQNALLPESNAARPRALSTVSIPEPLNRAVSTSTEDRLQIPQAPDVVPDQSRRHNMYRARQLTGASGPPLLQHDRQLSTVSLPNEDMTPMRDNRLSNIVLPLNRLGLSTESAGIATPRSSFPFTTPTVQSTDTLNTFNTSPWVGRRSPVPDEEVLTAIRRQTSEAVEGRPRGLSVVVAASTPNYLVPQDTRTATSRPRELPSSGVSISLPDGNPRKTTPLFLPKFNSFSPKTLRESKPSFEDREKDSHKGTEATSMLLTSPSTQKQFLSTPTSTISQGSDGHPIANRSLSTMPELGTGHIPVSPRSPLPFKAKQENDAIATNEKKAHRRTQNERRRRRGSSVVFRLGEQAIVNDVDRNPSDKEDVKSERQSKSASSKDSSSHGNTSARKKTL